MQMMDRHQMNVDALMEYIIPSQSDRLLHQSGFDLVREYFHIAQQIPPAGLPVLELATGTGRMSAVLASLFPSVITGDISLSDLPRTLNRIPSQYSHRVGFLQLDMEQLPFRTGSIQSIFCLNTLHETEHPQHCLQEMIRIAHHNGHLVIGDFNRTGFDAMQKIHQTVYHNDHSEGTITSEAIKEILERSFDSIRTVATPLNITFIATKKHSSP